MLASLRYGQIDSALPTYPIRHFVSTENAGRGYTRAIGGKSYVERVLRVRLLRSIDSCSNEDSDIKHPVRQLFLPSSRIANLPFLTRDRRAVARARSLAEGVGLLLLVVKNRIRAVKSSGADGTVESLDAFAVSRFTSRRFWRPFHEF